MTSVFHFHPIGTAARAVWTIAALRYQAFQAHVAGGAKEVGADVALLKVTDESVAGAGRQSPQKEMAPARWGRGGCVWGPRNTGKRYNSLTLIFKTPI